MSEDKLQHQPQIIYVLTNLSKRTNHSSLRPLAIAQTYLKMAKYPFHVLRLGWAIYVWEGQKQPGPFLKFNGQNSILDMSCICIGINSFKYDVCLFFLGMYSTYSKMQYVFTYYSHQIDHFYSSHPSKGKTNQTFVPAACAVEATGGTLSRYMRLNEYLQGALKAWEW